MYECEFKMVTLTYDFYINLFLYQYFLTNFFFSAILTKFVFTYMIFSYNIFSFQFALNYYVMYMSYEKFRKFVYDIEDLCEIKSY